MPLVKRFEDLNAWQAARQLTQMIYALTTSSPFRLDFSLADQINRASLSVMNNIAEGFDGGSAATFEQFLGYASRSGSEAQSCLYAALDRAHVTQTQFQQLYSQAERSRSLIAGLIRYLRSSGTPARPHARSSARPLVRT